MTNSIGYANPAAVSFGTITLEHSQSAPEDRSRAASLVSKRLPLDQAVEVLAMLGLLPPRPGRE